MLRIRLRRIGKKNQPSYRIVLAQQRSKSQGQYLENLGFYNPRKKEIKLKKERILHWLGYGAQASVTVHNLLVSQGVIKGVKKKAWYGHPKNKATEKSDKKEEKEKKVIKETIEKSEELKAQSEKPKLKSQSSDAAISKEEK